MRSFAVFCIVIVMPFIILGQDLVELSIDEAVETALKNNDLLISENYRVKEAETIKSEAFSNFFPRIDAVGSKLLKEKPMVVEFPSMEPGEPPSKMEISFARDYSISMQASQPIFMGGQIFYSWEIAKKNLEISRIKYKEQRDELIFQVKSTYYLCYILSEILDAVKEGIELSREHFRQVDAFYQAGNATYQEWLRAKVQLSNLDPDLQEAESNLSNAYNMLKLLLGVESEIKLTTKLDFEEEIALDEGKYKENIGSNPGLKQILKAMDIADYQRKISWGDYLPKLSLSIDYTLGADDFKLESDSWDKNYSITFNVQFTLFDGFARGSRRARAKFNMKALEHQAAFYEKRLKNELEQILNNIETSLEKTKSYRANLADAMESVRVSKLYYEEGLLTSFEVNASNLDYTKAKISYLNAVYDYYLSVFKLEKLIPEIVK